ncbi:MAG TPA: ABC transporter ATP-binding protein [Chloroflexi bacterium]|nr:ABC transporter ATP-binding protein [Chloroflexota bacterium]
MSITSQMAIRFDRVSKKFILHKERPRSFQELALSLFRRHNDPHSRAHLSGDSQEEFWALKEVSFTVERGESVGLIGPNGAGKSTALKLVARVLEPSSGRVMVNGQVAALLELGAGFHPDLTGRENIYLNGAVLGFDHKGMRRRFDAIVAFSELEPFIDVPIKHYSSGMYMRLAFAVAVNVDPEILLVDEILAVGDSAFQRKCLDRIYDMRQQGVTILMVSHNLDATARLCNRAVWLEDGLVQLDGDSHQVADRYLQWVNEKDQVRLEKSRSEQASHRDEEAKTKGARRRSGTGEIRITEVEFLDVHGNAVHTFRTGDSMTVRLHYHAAERVERPVFGIGLYRDDDLHVSGPNTYTDGLTIPMLQGDGYLDYIVDSLLLMKGHYELTVAVYDETISHQFDGLYRAFDFTVQPRTPWDALGVVRLPGRWQLPVI